MSIKDNYFDLILKYANKYKQPKHNTKYLNKYYLTHRCVRRCCNLEIFNQSPYNF